MNFKTFGTYLLLGGIILLGPACYFLYTVHNDVFQSNLRGAEEIGRMSRAVGRSSGLSDDEVYFSNVVEVAENKSINFGVAGGLLIFIGFGMVISSKKKPLSTLAIDRLISAISAGDIALVKEHLTSEVDLSQKDKWGLSPLRCAEQHNNAEIYALLKAHVSAVSKAS